MYYGQDTNTLNYMPVEPETLTFRCTVTDSAGNSIISDAANITVIVPDPIEVQQQPANKTERKGITLPLQFQVIGGVEPLSYQWQGSNDGINWVNLKNSDPGIDDADSWFLTVYTDETTFYKYARCIVTDAVGQSVTSRAATITITEKLKVKINNGETEYTIAGNLRETKLLTANVTGGEGPYTYKWYVKTYSGQWEEVDTTSSSHEVKSWNTGNGTRYKVEVKDSTGKKVTSQEVTIYITGQIN